MGPPPGAARGGRGGPPRSALDGKGAPVGKGTAAGTVQSGLVDYLLEEWAWGRMAPQQVQAICDKAFRDASRCFDAAKQGAEFIDIPDLQRLSKIAAEGNCPQNAHRDLERCMAPMKLPEPYKFQLRCATETPGIYREHPFEMLLPHEWFHAVYTDYPEHFKEYICGGEHDVQSFWDDVSSHPNVVGNIVRTIPDCKRKVIPISLHGDGVPIKGVGKSWSESQTAYSWCSLLCTRGSTSMYNFLICTLFQHLVAKSPACRTMARFWKILCWSLEAMYDGRFPTQDWEGNPIGGRQAGTPLAGGYRCMVFLLKGDLEYLSKDSRAERARPLNFFRQIIPAKFFVFHSSYLCSSFIARSFARSFPPDFSPDVSLFFIHCIFAALYSRRAYSSPLQLSRNTGFRGRRRMRRAVAAWQIRLPILGRIFAEMQRGQRAPGLFNHAPPRGEKKGGQRARPTGGEADAGRAERGGRAKRRDDEFLGGPWGHDDGSG